MSLPVIKDQSVISQIKIVDSLKCWTLNFTDISSNHNKFYLAEVVKSDKGKFFLFTHYGRVGQDGAKEYRRCNDQNHAETEGQSIIKSKLKKGYVEIKIAKSDIGSEIGKTKVDTSVTIESLKKMGATIVEGPQILSKLQSKVQDLIRTWFGVTQEFIELNLDTKKCPLGQLSIDQIDKAKQILEEARKIVHSKSDEQELNRLTSSYYSNIPHILAHKIDANMLRFDNDVKIDHALDILDVFGDAKNVQAVISKRSAVDSQYATLKANIEYIDPSEPTWKWIQAMVLETRAHNHSALGKLKVHQAFRITRNGEEKQFIKNAEKLAKTCGKSSPSSVYAELVKRRPDVSKEMIELYRSANILPGWHGTRRANMIGITTKGLLIRPSGVICAGSSYGDGIYWASNSSKSINYCDVRGSYWAQGNNKTAYLFLADVAFGNQKLVTGSSFYTANNIKPFHSVFAQAGKGGVINDEMITYHPTGPNQQHMIRYIIEFETQA